MTGASQDLRQGHTPPSLPTWQLVTEDGPHPPAELLPSPPRSVPRRPRRPCHYRAIQSGPDRSPADNHGQCHGGPDLRRFDLWQVTRAPDLALQAGGRWSRLASALPCLAGQPNHHCGNRAKPQRTGRQQPPEQPDPPADHAPQQLTHAARPLGAARDQQGGKGRAEQAGEVGRPTVALGDGLAGQDQRQPHAQVSA
jgi:hypothetical protein